MSLVDDLRASTFAESVHLRGHLVVTATCPIDGGPLVYVNGAPPSPTELSLVTRCADCGSEHHVTVNILTTVDSRFKRAPVSRDGTNRRRRAR